MDLKLRILALKNKEYRKTRDFISPTLFQLQDFEYLIWNLE